MGRNKRIKTRGSYFFGAPQPIPADGSLPTLGDVVRAAYYEKELNETLSDSQAAVAITPQVFKKWSENNPELKRISENFCILLLTCPLIDTTFIVGSSSKLVCQAY